MIKKITSYILSVILAITAMMLTISFLLKWNLKEENITTFIKENDLTFILKTKDGIETNLLNDIKSALKTIGIPENTITEIINSEATKRFLGKYTYHVLNYMIYDKGSINIKKEDVIKLAKDNFPLIEEILKKQNLSFQKEQKEKILKIIEEQKEDIMTLFPTTKILESKIKDQSITIYKNVTLKDVKGLLKIVSNKSYIIVMLINIIVCVGALLIINYQSIHFIKYIKISLLLYTFFFIGIEIFLGTVFKEYLMLEWKSANSFFNYTVNKISKNLWIFIIISIILILIANKIIKKKGSKKENENVK